MVTPWGLTITSVLLQKSICSPDKNRVSNMAPVPGISKEHLLTILRKFEGDSLTISLGSPHRYAQISFDGTIWTLYPMVSNHDVVMRESLRLINAGQSFQPEHVVDLQEPGAPIIQAQQKDTFIAAISEIPWRPGGPDLSQYATR